MSRAILSSLAVNELAYAEGAADAYEDLIKALPYNVPGEVVEVITRLAGDAVVAVGEARRKAARAGR